MPSDAYDEPDRGRWGSWLQPQFDTPRQQFEAARLGMWCCVALEVVFFGAAIVLYGVYRNLYPEAFEAGSAQLQPMLGGAGTCALLVGSFTVVMAVRSAKLGERSQTTAYLGVTIACALVFLVLELVGYRTNAGLGLLPGEQFEPVLRSMQPWIAGQDAVTALPVKTHVFFGIFFVLTGLHGVLVAVGLGVLVWVLLRNQRGHFSRDYWTPVDAVALHVHLVALVWVFLFPLLYLI